MKKRKCPRTYKIHFIVSLSICVLLLAYIGVMFYLGSRDLKDGGDLKIEYSEVNSTYSDFAETIEKSEILEGYVDNFNSRYILPEDVVINLTVCESDEYYGRYGAENNTIEICFDSYHETYEELLENMSEEEAITLIKDDIVLTSMHELGHALVYLYMIPLTGRMEVAADQIAAFLVLTSGVNDSEYTMTGKIELLSISMRDEEIDFSDVHLTYAQEYYDALCWLYGKDPENFEDLGDFIPETRIGYCETEWAIVSDSWSEIFYPYTK